jgi:hypothetical protein
MLSKCGWERRCIGLAIDTEDPVLGDRLRTLVQFVLHHRNPWLEEIMGSHLDAMKFKSSMTLFSLVSPDESIFHQCLNQFFGGRVCPITVPKMGHVIGDGDAKDNETDDSCKCSVV